MNSSQRRNDSTALVQAAEPAGVDQQAGAQVLGLRHLLRRNPLSAGGGAPNCVQGLHISKIDAATARKIRGPLMRSP